MHVWFNVQTCQHTSSCHVIKAALPILRHPCCSDTNLVAIICMCEGIKKLVCEQRNIRTKLNGVRLLSLMIIM